MWEYLIVDLGQLSGGNLAKLQSRMDELGGKGWELVCTSTGKFGQAALYFYFKRPKK
jgi:hypothetical protein